MHSEEVFGASRGDLEAGIVGFEEYGEGGNLMFGRFWGGMGRGRLWWCFCVHCCVLLGNWAFNTCLIVKRANLT